jgi:VanZ family protein
MGALWEIAEWTYDQFVRPNAILSKTDTIVDLIVDTIGALVAGVIRSGMIRK